PVPARVALWLLFALSFAVLAALASANDRFPADLWLAHRLQDIDAWAFVRAVDWAEDLGDSPLILAVAAAAAALLAAASLRLEAALVLLALLASPLNAGVKELVDRPRPDAELIRVGGQHSDSSFPSGHADSVLVLYGLLFYFVTLFVRRRALRLLGQAACLWVIVFTGMERVYVGAHWPSDILGGYYLGALILTALIAAHRIAGPSRGRVTAGGRPRY
ncbi:MAG TPA: phosphatase PAP2 family protein, partial [Methylomirabilota bacterium]|nr:phosphatase PAP2 family protein [Methylomirabilota bacterium]